MIPRRIRLLHIALLLALLPLVTHAASRGNGNGGGGMMRENIGFDWQSSLSAGLSWARSENGPVALVICAPDDKMVEKMASWPQAIELSRGKMAAVKAKATSPEAVEIIARLNLKVPAVVFIDKYGNPLAGMPVPDAVQPIAAAVAGWKQLTANIDTFFKEHETRGTRLMDHGKLKDAYLEFSFGAPFKGVEADKARAGKNKVEEHWLKLLDLGAKMPAGSIGQQAVFKGLRKETLGTAFAATMEQYLKDPSQASSRGDGSMVAAAPVQSKSLAEMARNSSSMVSASSREDNDDSAVDSGFLLKTGDPKLVEAEKLLNEGFSEYKKAVADSSDRGPARNALLQSAHAKFEKTLTLCEESTKTKPNAQVDKLMERTSMLMYGTLKYQSL